MNHREHIFAVFKEEMPDRVPWFADLTWWASAMEQRGQVPAGLYSGNTSPGWQPYLSFDATPDLFELHRELNVGFYFGSGYFPFETEYDDTVRIMRETHGNTLRQTIETPVGALIEGRIYLVESYTEAISHRPIKSPADLRVLRYLVEHTHYRPDYSVATRRRALLGDLGIVMYCLPKTPAMELITEKAGIQTFVDLWLDARAELEETLQIMEQKYDEAAAIVVASPVEFVWSPMTLSSEIVGDRFFERYVSGYERKWIERLHQAGKWSIIHMDGTLRGLIRHVAALGYDAIEAITPTPVGDLTMSEARELVGPDIILWGGLPSVYFTSLVDEDEFERLVREVLWVMTREPRYVLGVADQVPPTALRQRVIRVAELVERYGVYTG